MKGVVQLPAFRTKTIDTFEDGSDITKIFAHHKLISLPSEYDFYMKKFKRVYRIELSHSTKRWVLTVDDGTCGYDQRGWYVRTLCAAIGWRAEDDIQQAIDIALKHLPDEKAFYYPDGAKYNSNDPEFEKFWAKVIRPKLTVEEGDRIVKEWEEQ